MGNNVARTDDGGEELLSDRYSIFEKMLNNE